VNNNYKKTLDAIDNAIGNHIKTNRSKSSMLTGWIVIASVSDAENADRDGYIMQSSQSLPHHTQIGLLSMALQDKKNLSLLSTIQAFMGGDDA